MELHGRHVRVGHMAVAWVAVARVGALLEGPSVDLNASLALSELGRAHDHELDLVLFAFFPAFFAERPQEEEVRIPARLVQVIRPVELGHDLVEDLGGLEVAGDVPLRGGP